MKKAVTAINDRRTLSIIMRFALAFLFFYGMQTYLFGQQPEKEAAATEQAAGKSTEKVAEEEYSSVFDEILDDSVREVAEYLQGTFLKPVAGELGVTLLLIPLLILASYLIGFVLRGIFFRPLLRKWAASVDEAKDKKLILSIRKVIIWFFIILGMRLSVVPIEAYFNTQIALLRNPANALLIINITFLVQKLSVALLRVWGTRLAERTESRVDDQLMPLLIGITRVLILIFGFLVAISKLNIDITPIIASLGALSFALGFAVKDSLSNFMAGIFLILEDAFNVDDKIDIPGIGMGFIHEIGLRTTKIQTFDNEVIVMPNNALMNQQYKNFRLPDESIRVVVSFGVAYGADIDHVKKTVMAVINSIEGVLSDPEPGVDFLEMADFSLNFIAKIYISDYGDHYGKKLELTNGIYNALNKAGIEIPFPTHTVYTRVES